MPVEQNVGEVILKAEHVGKEYILGTVTGRTLRDAFVQRFCGEKKGLQKHNPGFTALEDISFEIRQGETVGLIGPNGAGKSTLLKLISRITAPTHGRIFLNGRVSSMLEVGTGFHKELTGRENIYLNGSILGMNRQEIDQKMDSIIAFSECEKFIDTPVKHYSSGMYVKLAFSVASHLESEIMIMDEILAVGDVKFQKKCLNKMREVAKTEGRTILYVSHNMDTIRMLCKRCIMLDHGHLVFDGATEDAIRCYLGEDLRTERSVDYSRYLRPGWLTREDVRLTFAEYPDWKTPVVKNSRMPLLLRWKCREDVEHMGLRVELMEDTKIPFATAVFHDVFSGKAGEESEAVFQVDLSHVMNGSYRTYYTLFCIDGYGNTIDLDCVQGMDVRVDRKANDDPLRWRNASWGNIQL